MGMVDGSFVHAFGQIGRWQISGTDWPLAGNQFGRE